MEHRRKYKVACSRKAWKEGIWPNLEWAIFDHDGNYVKGGFRTRKDACAYRDEHCEQRAL